MLPPWPKGSSSANHWPCLAIVRSIIHGAKTPSTEHFRHRSFFIAGRKRVKCDQIRGQRKRLSIGLKYLLRRLQRWVGLSAIALAGCHGTDRDALSWELPKHAAACAPVRNSATDPVAMLRPGRYELTLIATAGSEAGRHTRGRLWLTSTSSGDRSPRTGQRVPSPTLSRVPCTARLTLR